MAKKTSRSGKSTGKSRGKKPHKGSENLILWKPGQSGNPKGRKPGSKSLVKCIQEQLDRKAAEVPVAVDLCEKFGLDPNECTMHEVFGAAGLIQALSGDSRIFKEILERQDGKVPDISLTAGGYGPLDDVANEDLTELAKVALKSMLSREGK